jgi:hypothetical protein
VDLTPFHLQVAGIAVVVLLGLGFLWWIVRSVIQWHNGRPLYVLPETQHDDHAHEDDDGDDETHIDGR